MLGREGLLVRLSGEGASLSHLCFKSHQVVSVVQAPPSAPALGPSSSREAAAAWGTVGVRCGISTTAPPSDAASAGDFHRGAGSPGRR